jgi:hypothetical protein|tara:strand:- start:609 stop:809 length:201 start_codon:yes stop_codon:yes gene_type:complete
MKIHCISWKDERWSADKESLEAINKLIMSKKSKLTRSPQWWKHLRKYWKRKFWKQERQNEKKQIKE